MVNYRAHSANCLQCEIHIDQAVLNYSTQHYGEPLCRNCQGWFQDILDYSSATNEAIDLYFALKKKGVLAMLEKNDGYKTIDIAVPDARVNIEVDGGHHNFNPRQAMSDLKRTYHSFKKGYLTLRIPNSLAKNHLEEAAELVTEFLIESRERNNSNKGHNENKKAHVGFCIRCKDELRLNPDRPFCSDCFSSWVQYENYTYEEANCHCCGNNHRTSMSKPLCLDCYKTINN